MDYRETQVGDFQVAWDGHTVWINGPDGMSRARYSKHAGIDLHHDTTTQLATGHACDNCGPGDWPTFVGLIRERLDLELPPEAEPRDAENSLD